MSDQCPHNSVDLLRLVWFPACFDNGRLTTAAFDKDDLFPKLDRNNQPRYVSADDADIVSQLSVDSTIKHQTRDDLRERENRNEARFIRFCAGDVRAIIDAEGIHPFIVERARLPTNLAHVSIKNTSGKSARVKSSDDRVYVEFLRTELFKIVTKIHTYPEIFPGP